MSQVKKIQQLIKTDIDTAFEWMDEVFEANNIQYNNLCKEYIDRPRDFQMTDYQSRLIRFVRLHRRDFGEPTSAKQPLVKYTQEDRIYALLCKLNFRHQQKYFYAALKSNLSLIPFVIRGQANRGQKWLCKRLIHQFDGGKNIHEVITINFKECPIFSLPQLFQQFEIKLKLERQSLSLAQQKMRLGEVLKARLERGPIFIIFENFASFSQCADFDLFYQVLEQWLGKWNVKPHPCICFFIENIATEYDFAHLCLFTEHLQTDALRNNQHLKFIDLNEIKAIDFNDIEDWLEEMHPEDYQVFSFLRDDSTTRQTLQQICDTQNFQYLIAFICRELGYDYENFLGPWRQKN